MTGSSDSLILAWTLVGIFFFAGGGLATGTIQIVPLSKKGKVHWVHSLTCLRIDFMVYIQLKKMQKF